MRKIFLTEPFKKDYFGLPQDIRKALDKALKFLIEKPWHPSLRTKKLSHTPIWYARITRGYRFTFHYEQNVIILRRAGTHAILDAERKSL